jgi:hypothetical protein
LILQGIDRTIASQKYIELPDDAGCVDEYSMGMIDSVDWLKHSIKFRVRYRVIEGVYAEFLDMMCDKLRREITAMYRGKQDSNNGTVVMLSIGS